MLHMLHDIPLMFQWFPYSDGSSMQHECSKLG